MAEIDEETFERAVVAHMDAMESLVIGQLLALKSSFEGDEEGYQRPYRTALDRSIQNHQFDTTFA
jgi:hypothetical protein